MKSGRPRRLHLLVLLASFVGACSEEGPAIDAGKAVDIGSPKPDAGKGKISTVLNSAYTAALYDLLDKAQSAVRVVHFYINKDTAGDEVVQRLGQVAKRGVPVYVLLEDSVTNNKLRVTELSALGIQAKVDTSKVYTHAKLVVVDGVRALLGSTNLSYSSVARNNEANLLVEEPGMAGFFAKFAETLWQDPGTRPAMTPVKTGLGQTLADGGYVDHVKELVQAASKEIMLVTYGMNADPKYPNGDVHTLIKELGKARARGLSVRVILEQANYTASVNALNQEAAKVLAQQGIEVRRDSLSQITHAKVFIADDEVILGSNNWGHGGFNLYHEVGIRTRHATVVKELKQYLEGIWKQGASF